MRLKISHTTRYAFERPVSYGFQQLRITPKPVRAQSVLHWTTTIFGGTKELAYEDYNNNRVELISFDRHVEELTIRAEGEVEIAETHGVVGPHFGPAPLWLYQRTTKRTRAGAGCRALLKQVEGDTLLSRLHFLSALILDEVAYETGSSTSDSSAEDAITEGKGVCQDHAHIMIACAREMKLPARYVSGYLMLDDRTAQEATHAWAEAYLEGLGWVGFDVSNGISPDIRYVRVATGMDYAEAAPITGTRVGGEGESLSVEIEVAQQ
ncbi:transglutaminase family protein [Pelagovum pacificum]|uniref:Transglutaminase family protein n=1 Tax=Pelagovum pacificum TaxID=2588711 RepID=A0A5C5G7V1_9RHOB|nr:transglutaminase family protein [Pelagovum pacificum]QQA41899.1 transglutaminase family protein [Pelagovum pacificum]TNY30779.1 transglutaminase family protein [Pelagovum pacificum]